MRRGSVPKDDRKTVRVENPSPHVHLVYYDSLTLEMKSGRYETYVTLLLK